MKNLGKIAGGLGLLLSLTSFITLLITTGSTTIFFVKLGVGLALLAVWAFTNGQSVTSWARSAFFYSSSVMLSAIFVAVLVAANFIAAKRAPTWDLTRKRIFSLSPQTEMTLKDLKEPVKVMAFVEGGGSPPELEDLFRRYAALNDKFTWEMKDPRKTPDLTARYQIRAGQPAAIITRVSGTAENYGVMNLVRLVDPQLGEQELTNGLIKLNAVGTQRLYFTVGHGECPLDPSDQSPEAAAASLTPLRRILQDEGYSPEALNLIERGEIPRDASTLVICGARTKFTDPEKKMLETYLEQGGRLLYLAEVSSEPGLDDLLAKYAVQVEPGVVADSKVNPENPYFVISPFFGDHVITKPLKDKKASVVMPTARGLTPLTQGQLSGVSVTPIVVTTPYAWVESSLSENPTQDAFERAGQVALAVVSTRRTADAADKRSEDARVVVFADSDVMVGVFGHDPNRDLVMNTIAWMTEQTQRITIRPPDRDISRIDLSPDLLSTIRLVSMDLLPVLLIGIGLTIWLNRRSR